MKKYCVFALCVVLALIFCCPAWAQERQIESIASGQKLDLDGDGQQETLSLDYIIVEDGFSAFTLTAGKAQVSRKDCEELTGQIFILPLNDSSTLVMVPQIGMSDVETTFCYVYESGLLLDAGTISSHPRNMSCSHDGLITARVRAEKLGTWFRPQDYALALIPGETDYGYQLYRVPRPIYPMGMAVTLKMDLPLFLSQSDDAPGITLEKGQKVLLAASDDVRWVYISTMDSSLGGWVSMGDDYLTGIYVNGALVPADDVFEGIFYAG